MIIHSSNINLTQSNYSNNTNTWNDPIDIKSNIIKRSFCTEKKELNSNPDGVNLSESFF